MLHVALHTLVVLSVCVCVCVCVCGGGGGGGRGGMYVSLTNRDTPFPSLSGCLMALVVGSSRESGAKRASSSRLSSGSGSMSSSSLERVSWASLYWEELESTTWRKESQFALVESSEE